MHYFNKQSFGLHEIPKFVPCALFKSNNDEHVFFEIYRFFIALYVIHKEECIKIPMTMIIRTSLSEIDIRFISIHHHDNFGKHLFDNYENIFILI